MRDRKEGTCPGALDFSQTASYNIQAVNREAGVRAKIVEPG